MFKGVPSFLTAKHAGDVGLEALYFKIICNLHFVVPATPT